MSEPILRTIKIADIRITDRFRGNFDQQKLINLADSIHARGQLQPIRVFEIPDTNPQQYELIAGGRRIRAFQLMDRDEIQAIIDDGRNASDPQMAEISENNDREPFTVVEKLRIAEYVRSQIPERRGKKPKVVDSSGVDKTPIWVELPREGEETIDFVARKAGFESGNTLIRARKAADDGIPEVVDAMDKGIISINRASVIASSPKSRQKTLLAEAVNDPDTLKTQLTKDATTRRAAKRKEKSGTPIAYTPCPEFKIIRVAPDWSGVFSDILDLPVNAYAHPEISVVAVECDTLSLPLALQCLDHWGFNYKSTITVWNPKGTRIGAFDYHHQIASYIIIGERNNSAEGTIFTLDQVAKVDPVIARYTTPLSDSLIHILDEMFPSKTDRRICMTSISKPKNWIAWKTSYGTNTSETAVDIGSVDGDVDDEHDTRVAGENNDSLPPDGVDAALDVNDDAPVQSVQTFGRTSPSPDPDSSSDAALDFEPVDEPEEIPEKRTLKVFEGD